MNVLIAGGTGLIGTAVRSRASAAGHTVRLLVRREGRSGEYAWDPVAGVLPAEAIAWAEAIISLNGATLTHFPWSATYRRTLRESRTGPTALLATAIADSDSPPRVWVSGSAVGFYGDRPGATLTEDSPAGTGFLAGLVEAWEAATRPAADATRVVWARTGLVLGPGGLAPLVRLARLGLAGPVGTGRQHWPWVSLADEVGALVHLLGSTLAGPVNLVSPAAATAAEVTRALAAAVHRPYLLPAPAWALRTLLGDAARDLLLADQHVLPARLLADGYTFAATDLAEAAATL